MDIDTQNHFKLTLGRYQSREFSEARTKTECFPIAELSRITQDIFRRSCQRLKDERVTVVSPTFFPQRHGILSEVATTGVSTLILGGRPGSTEFKCVPQIGVEGIQFGGGAPESIAEITQILGALPVGTTRIGLRVYEYPLWEEYLTTLRPDVEIVASDSNYLQPLLENKSLTTELLERAELADFAIPSMLLPPHSGIAAQEVIEKLGTEKLVVQIASFSVADLGSGKTTRMVDTTAGLEDILQSCAHVQIKISARISGSEGNLSFVCLNHLPAEAFGLKTARVPVNLDTTQRPAALVSSLEKSAREAGFRRENTFGISGKGTLKLVGDPTLTSSSTNGVGNILGHVYDDAVNQQIHQIGLRLSAYLASLGYVGLAGVDFLVQDGRVFVNEINCRQQGPTLEMSVAAETNHVPGLAKLGFLGAFGDARCLPRFLRQLEQCREAIAEEYLNITTAPFYLKFHSKGEVSARKDFTPGVYSFSLNPEDGRFVWREDNSSSSARLMTFEGPRICAGDTYTGGVQLFRIKGDFAIPLIGDENGRLRINNPLAGALRDLYDDLFSSAE